MATLRIASQCEDVVDERLKGVGEENQIPLDYKRMAYGGFQTLVKA